MACAWSALTRMDFGIASSKATLELGLNPGVRERGEGGKEKAKGRSIDVIKELKTLLTSANPPECPLHYGGHGSLRTLEPHLHTQTYIQAYKHVHTPTDFTHLFIVKQGQHSDVGVIAQGTS